MNWNIYHSLPEKDKAVWLKNGGSMLSEEEKQEEEFREMEMEMEGAENRARSIREDEPVERYNDIDP